VRSAECGVRSDALSRVEVCGVRSAALSLSKGAGRVASKRVTSGEARTRRGELSVNDPFAENIHIDEPTLLHILAKDPRIEVAYLLGGAARNEMHPGSDVDIAAIPIKGIEIDGGAIRPVVHRGKVRQEI